MKRLQTIVAAAAMLFATSAFASNGPEKVAPEVKAAFEKSFTSAQNVSWDVKEGFYFATFMMNAKEVSAAYNENGELLGVSRVIPTSQLPMNVNLALANKYKGYTVNKTATELTYNGETRYYVTVVNDKQAVKLKCYDNGNLYVEEKSK
ncbi:MAG: hypothetical protein JST86_02485 [Bacteroidetes bacterium]|nr:hypothetical protein [Bacteroidota bacterium]